VTEWFDELRRRADDNMMTLSIGSHVGPYEVTGAIGRGGMGEVYRATDANLKRSVALKVLPESIAADADRLARFQREAEVLAALNHPHIAAIYGLERSAGTIALVMELVEGPTLADRIKTGRIPAAEVLIIARQIAEALEAAHERGIVHRDLKPANIKVRPDDAVKILDFGLAKISDPVGPPSDTNSTMTSPAMTQAGMILGTAAYMSPEQAKGRAVDRRADVWAFGAVLYEMLTGQRAFAGDDVSDVLASVLAREPDWTRLPADTPVLNACVRRCLERDPRQRFGDMQSLRLALDGAFSTAGMATSNVIVPALRARGSFLAWAIAGIATIAAVVLGIAYIRHRAPERLVIRSMIPPPDGTVFDFDVTAGPAALSPNGASIAFAARSSDGRIRLWVRPLDGEPRPIEGTDDASFPFWSPDSQSIAFYNSPKGRIERVEIAGGAPVAIATARFVRGGSWAPDGAILFEGSGGISEVPSSGGRPQTLISKGFPRSPWILPDGRHFLYYSVESHQIRVALRDGTMNAAVAEATSNAIYASGRILFLREDTLIAQPFDLARLSVTGSPIAAARGVQMLLGETRGLFSASETGTLIYQDAAPGSATSLVWFDAAGKRQTPIADVGSSRGVRLSPNGESAAMGLIDPEGRLDVWRVELASGRRTRLTFSSDGNLSSFMAWSPDGRSIAYGARRDGGLFVVRRSASGGAEETLSKVPPEQTGDIAPRVTAWTTNGVVVYSSRGSAGSIWTLPVVAAPGGSRAATSIVRDPENAQNVRTSPNERWVVYQGGLDAAPISGIFVEAFPTGGHRQQVTDRGSLPLWSADGRSLYYASDNMLTVVDVTEAEGALRFGPPRALMPVIVGRGYSYDVAKDGRILALVTSEARAARPLRLVQQWTAMLKDK
jgi:serine/threonine protein kinase/Tol biopolymer transport system component